MAVTITERGLEIDGKHIPVYSGTIHYWRLERERWPLILDRAQALGFGMIETYIPWSIHETAPGVFDWGETDPRKDFEAFCELCEARGIYLLVRPGPLINAELTDFGFPEWALLDPAMQEQTSLGTIHLDAAYSFHPPRPFPVPSYASPEFLAAVGGWFDVVCPKIERHIAPRGCIVGVQSDNETCYLFQDQAYATDYSPASLAAYRKFLAERYGDIARLNTLYETSYAAFAEVEPPRDGDIVTRSDVPPRRDWVEYKERDIHETVAGVARLLRERGMQGAPIFHDVAWQYYSPLDIARLQADPAVDWVGINFYRDPPQYAASMQLIRYLVGMARLPFVPEFISGLWSHHPKTPEPAEEEFITLAALMHGLRAINFYMLVERERWQGSPITRHGAYRPGYADFYRRLSTFLERYPLGAFRRRPRVVALLNYDLGRYSALASTLHYGHVDLLGLPPELSEVDADLGFRWDALREARLHQPDNWLGRACAVLDKRAEDYDLADSHIDLARLSRYPVALLPTTDFMDGDDQRKLLAYVEQGGHLIIGPGVPYLNSQLQPLSVLGAVIGEPGEARYGAGRITWVTTEGIAATLAELADTPSIRWDAPEVEVVEQIGEASRLYYVANPTASAQHVTLSFAQPQRLTAAWGATPEADLSAQAARATTLTLNLAPYTIQIWEAHT